MAKLEPFDSKITNWVGLWWHPECNAFTSAVFDLSELRKFKGKVRLQMRKNKFYNGGENNRPNYNFCLRDASADVFVPMEVRDDDYDNTHAFLGEDGNWYLNNGAPLCVDDVCDKGEDVDAEAWNETWEGEFIKKTVKLKLVEEKMVATPHGFELHSIYDAKLGLDATLHRFLNPAGTPYSAIYRGDQEILSCERNHEEGMISYWEDEYINFLEEQE